MVKEILTSLYIIRQKNKLHPTQKPVDMTEYMLSKFSDEGDVILDPFMGSGTTGVACVNTGRNFIGMELDEKYFKIAKDRIEKAFDNGGITNGATQTEPKSNSC